MIVDTERGARVKKKDGSQPQAVVLFQPHLQLLNHMSIPPMREPLLTHLP